MTQYRVTVDSAAVRRALEAYQGPFMAERLRGALTESTEYLKGEVQTRMPSDMGLLRGSVFAALRGTEVGIVGTPLEYGVAVELGRAPGSRPPPSDVIEAWAQRHGLGGLGFVIARAIGRRGIKGRFMFRDAAQQGRRTVLRIFLDWFAKERA